MDKKGKNEKTRLYIGNKFWPIRLKLITYKKLRDFFDLTLFLQ
jgi:hypothetical protein